MISIFIGMCLFAGCPCQAGKKKVLFDFETDACLDRIRWRCHTRFSLENVHATHGRRSLRMVFYPSEYPAFSPMIDTHDIQCYKGLSIDIYNPENGTVHIHVRIDDKKGAMDPKDRYHQLIALKPGHNQIRMPFRFLRTTGTRRLMEPKDICKFSIYMTHLNEPVVLFFDYIHYGKMFT